MCRCKPGRHPPRMQDGLTPLHRAKTAEVVNALVKAKADVNFEDEVMCAYLYVCVSRGSGGEGEVWGYDGWGKQRGCGVAGDHVVMQTCKATVHHIYTLDTSPYSSSGW